MLLSRHSAGMKRVVASSLVPSKIVASCRSTNPIVLFVAAADPHAFLLDKHERVVAFQYQRGHSEVASKSTCWDSR